MVDACTWTGRRSCVSHLPVFHRHRQHCLTRGMACLTPWRLASQHLHLWLRPTSIHMLLTATAHMLYTVLSIAQEHQERAVSWPQSCEVSLDVLQFESDSWFFLQLEARLWSSKCCNRSFITPSSIQNFLIGMIEDFFFFFFFLFSFSHDQSLSSFSSACASSPMPQITGEAFKSLHIRVYYGVSDLTHRQQSDTIPVTISCD